MTETTTKSITRVRAEIRHLLRLSAVTEIPLELLPRQLAALMAGCRRTDDRKRYDVEATLIAEGIRDKLLNTIEKSETTTPPPREIGFVKAWSHRHYGRDPDMLYQPDPVTTRWQVVDCAAVVAWLRAIVEAPSEHVRAWLGTVWHEEGQGASKVDGKKESIRSILQRIGAIDSAFSPDAMPGIKGDFFALCKKLDRENFAYISQATFDGYLSGICKFRKGSRHSDYYEKIEAQMGVKSVKPL